MQRSCAPVLLSILACGLLLLECTSAPESAGGPQPAGQAPPPVEKEQQLLQRRLESAREHFRHGEYEISRRLLREIAEPDHPEALFLLARIALAEDDLLLASFYLRRVLEGDLYRLPAEQRPEAARLLGDLSYDSGDLEEAYQAYLQAVNLSAGRVPPEIWSRLAEIAFYRRNDAEAARAFLLERYDGRAPGPAEEAGEGALMQRLSRRLRFGNLGPQQFGLQDANISALGVDGDDLWIGTWNGGICRYSVGRGSSTVFESGGQSLIPRTVRSIEITPTRIWIGTYQGLYQYTKSNSRWQRIGFFEDERIEALVFVDDTLYVGTLGSGLWRSAAGGWERIRWSGLPGDFVNCLLAAGEHLLIGTLNLGVAVLELKTGRVTSFDSINPNLTARNVITLLLEDENTLWIGTYGEGLYRWNRAQNRIEHFSRASGQLADDWILCAVRAESGLYFGTFGGGLSRLPAGRTAWEHIGLGQGMSALDISTAAYSPPRLYFGTLGSGITILDETLIAEGAR
jgi:tetratricopeptide (TPR) repeat protein